jgi:hypothetical protein
LWIERKSVERKKKMGCGLWIERLEIERVLGLKKLTLIFVK